MGQPKLLLRLGGESLIRRLIRQLTRPEVTAVLVLVRDNDELLQWELNGTAVRTVLSSDTEDMKASVTRLLETLDSEFQPRSDDGWLLIPADHPVVEAPVLCRLIQEWTDHPGGIIIPCHAGERGHPTILPWSLARELTRIPADRGFNWLIRHTAIPTIEVDCPEPSILWDIDTPQEFSRIKALLETDLE